eukprot:TRINITY_DN3895_c0_g1_i1.p1 TRINITY_DN3895_c0_g1~~TRINITY_DN3895_c0_g1_i1.p1  ORF type:complete len:331 (+),score=51.28 TRINITY_DN3895_c0_g1_i1:1033-2025(+)
MSYISELLRRFKDSLSRRYNKHRRLPQYTGGSDPSLESMFNKSHLSGGNVLDWILLALYFPWGLGLFIIRFNAFIALMVSVTILNFLGLSKYIFTPAIRNLLLKFFGVWTITALPDPFFFSRHKPPYIVTSNHLTAVDVLPFLQFGPLDVVIDRDFFNSSWVSVYFLKGFEWILGTIKVAHLGPEQNEEREKQKQHIKNHLEKAHRPLLIFPEGWDSNGSSVMTYQKFSFGLGLKIVPAAIQCHVPLLPIHPGMLGTTVFAEIFWLFFSPMYVFRISVLPAMESKPNEDSVAFAQRVQEATAYSLGVRATKWTKKDALNYRRSLLKAKSS